MESIPTTIVTERLELAKFCSSRDWSKAIRILDSLLSRSCVIQDLCNRAFCYSQLELHKHVIKDCDKALQLDPTILQPYILKGRALSALGRKEESVLVWEQGFGYSVSQSTDFKQLLELEELLSGSKRNTTSVSEIQLKGSCTPAQSSCISESDTPCKSRGTPEIRDGSTNKSATCNKPNGTSDAPMKSSGTPETCRTTNGTSLTPSKQVCASEKCNDSNSTSGSMTIDTSKRYGESKDATSETQSESSGGSKTIRKLMISPDKNRIDSVKKCVKVFPTGGTKTVSISLDIRLSRGIAQVNEGKYAQAVSLFDQILKENPTYPEALIGRGTAYAFLRELDVAIADFSKAIKVNPSAVEAWKRRGQARAALGESVEAIEDLSKALEYEPNSLDILQERGIVNYKFKDYNAAVEDLSSCVLMDKNNSSAYSYLGMALAAIGEYKKAEEAHTKSIKVDKGFLEGWFHLAQFYQDLANPGKAFECLKQVLQIDGRWCCLGT